MSRMGVPAAMGIEPDVCFLAPHRHASGHRLTGQRAIHFITWEKPVARLAAAKGLEQLQRVGADADGAGRRGGTDGINCTTRDVTRHQTVAVRGSWHIASLLRPIRSCGGCCVDQP